MKKLLIILFLLSLLFISSCAKEVIKESSFCKKPYFEFRKGECCLDNNDNSICDSDEVKEEPKEEIKEVKEEPKVEEAIEEPKITEPDLLEEATYNLTIGDTAKFNKIEIKLLNLNIGENLYADFDIGGKKITVFDTKNEDIVGDVSLYIDSIFGAGDYVGLSLKVKRFTLQQDHYIVRAGDTLNIGNKEIYIIDILKEKEASILFDIDTLLKERIQEGRSKVYDNLEITNVKVYFKGSRTENYAILKIVQK